MGQSRRRLFYRLNEHTREVHNLKEFSTVASHVRDKKHNIDFENIRIIDKEANHKKRLFSEMLNIQFSDNTLNRIEQKIP